MKILRKEEGQVLVLTVLCMSVLIGFVALATDAGLLFRARRKMQTAADSAAFAGAVQLFYNGTANITSAATAAAKANGVDNSISGNYVQVYNPPADGPNTGCASCVEVVVRTPNRTFLTAFTGTNSFNVGARAVAGAPGHNSNCIWLVDPSMSGQLQMQGGANSQLNASGCSVYLNSNSNSAVSLTGNPTVNVVALNDVSTQNVSTKGNFSGTVNSGVTPQSPPLPANFDIPSNTCTGHTDSTTTSISGNYFASAPSADTVVCFSKAITLSNGAYLQGAADDGVLYVFQAGLTIANGATVNVGHASYSTSDGTFTATQGATLDLEGGSFSMSPNSSTVLNAYAPTSGTYNGIALMQPSSNTSSSPINECNGINSCLDLEFGASGSYFDGMIFDPGGQVILHDAGGCGTGSGGVKATGIIAASMNIKSSCLTITNYTSDNPYTSPLTLITMVE
jgi:hypothetical protein